MTELSAIVTTTSRSMKMPPAGLQFSAESEFHLEFSQLVPPIRIAGHESTNWKLIPSMVDRIPTTEDAFNSLYEEKLVELRIIHGLPPLAGAFVSLCAPITGES